MTRLLLVGLVAAGSVALMMSACTGTPAGPREVCGNLIDDDNNGLIDCADPDCKGKSECFFDGGFFGSCSKCGQACTTQAQCLQTSYFNDVPLPRCESGKCSALASNVQVDVILKAQDAWGTLISPTRSIITRFIRRQQLDGGAVTCSTIEAATPGRTAADAQQLEASGRFSFLGLDSRPIKMGSGTIPLRLLNVTVGSDYLIWMEMWAGPPDSTTKFPTGRRLGFECFDGPAVGQTWTPIVATDNCAPPGFDAGAAAMCRAFDVTARLGPQP